MSDRLTDDFDLVLSGARYTFRWGLNEVIEMQERLVTENGDVPSVEQIDAGIKAGRLNYQRAMIFAGLRVHHPTLTWDGVTEVMATMSGAEHRALLVAFGYSVTPDPRDLADLKVGTAEANPPTAQSGVTSGVSSTSTPVASV